MSDASVVADQAEIAEVGAHAGQRVGLDEVRDALRHATTSTVPRKTAERKSALEGGALSCDGKLTGAAFKML